MKKFNSFTRILAVILFSIPVSANAQVVISQYYEGGGTNKWIELTNLGTTSVNTASPQLKLGLWAVSGSTGNISFPGAPSNTYNLTVTIPAKGSVLIGNTGNGTEVPYLTAGSANETSNSVINFNGNDGVGLLDASNNIIDKFGDGINAADISYVRSTAITGPNATYTGSEWTNTSLAAVQSAAASTSPRLGYQLQPLCTAPANSATSMVFTAVTSNSMTTSFTAAGSVDGYLVVRSTASSLSGSPVNGTAYTAGNSLGGGTVISAGSSISINQSSLSPSTTYYFYVFTYNSVNCSGAPVYKTTPLSGNRATDDATLSFYFGNLHSHSSYSDGNKDNTSKTPADDYAFAKTAMCMDFLGISEHNHSEAGMSLSDWQPGINEAAAATTSTFIAMHGQEWGVIGDQGTSGDHAGHVLVYGLDSLAGWEAGNYQLYVPKSTYLGATGLFAMINRHGSNAFATLAHPDNYDYNDILHSTYNTAADDAIVGSCVETGPAFSTNTSYTDPSSLSFFAFYKNMLGKGYHLGPTIDHDNHNMTFGKTAKTRLAVLATSLSEANILDAMRKMRFYATEDCAAKINFNINTNYPVGSIITKAGAPVITVTTITGSTVTSIKLMHGVPGSGSAATTLTSTTGSSLTYTHNALANLATEYYFLDITESDGSRIITSPIWYTRDNSASRAMFVTSFFTINEADKVVLKWTATNEPPGESYEIQRSVDGRNFINIGNTDGKAYDMSSATYTIDDINPVNGLSYYRLVNKNAGNITYSELKAVNRGMQQPLYVIAYPNPVKNMLYVKIASSQPENTRLDVLDMSGRILKSTQLKINSGEQVLQIDMSALSSGTYILKTQLAGKTQVQVISKL